MATDPKPVDRAWRSFAEAALPADVGPGQHNDMRVAFYAGAQAVWSTMLKNTDDGTDDVTAANVAHMDAINAELKTFADQLAASNARRRPGAPAAPAPTLLVPAEVDAVRQEMMKSAASGLKLGFAPAAFALFVFPAGEAFALESRTRGVRIDYISSQPRPEAVRMLRTWLGQQDTL